MASIAYQCDADCMLPVMIDWTVLNETIPDAGISNVIDEVCQVSVKKFVVLTGPFGLFQMCLCLA